MEINLVGRVNNLPLAASSALMPLYEAVVNSIQAIEDFGGTGKGNIRIHIRRGDEQQGELVLGERLQRPIVAFEITDDGIGFNTDNFKSFETSDSRWKERRGGKGIGRLFWLKAFDQVEIDSIFLESSKLAKRKILFTLGGVEASLSDDVTSRCQRATTIRLLGFKEEYRKACKKRASSIASRVVEHCLTYFLGTNCPEITLTDDDEDETISLNKWFSENIGASIVREKFKIEIETFEVVGLPLYSSDENTSRLHWCSNSREVRSEPLSRMVPNLKGKIKDSDGDGFIFVAYLYGEYLDKHVNSERTAFNIPEEDLPKEESLDLKTGPSLDSIRVNAAKVISKTLKDTLEPIAKEKKDQVEKYVRETAPQYRPLVTYDPGILDSISPGLSEDKLDMELHQAQYLLEKRMKEESKEFFANSLNSFMPLDQREKLESEFLQKISAVNHAHLAKYVLSRKMILDIYDSAIKQKVDGSFDREEVVHNLVFPRFRTSDQIGYNQHNLWLLDERLSYHHYLASEKQFRSVEGIESESAERADVLIFNRSTAFTEGDAPYSSVVVIEFKRPGREDSTKEERDPIQQMLDYTEEVRAGKKRAADGQQLLVPQAIPFFAYLVCDLTEDIRRAAKGKDLMLTADGLGFFGYNRTYCTYIEILSYKKVGLDARRRNRVFFDKLGIS